ncbi:hypothetical protein U1Q18_019784 [Sarracenia purpurea var. burkii]
MSSQICRSASRAARSLLSASRQSSHVFAGKFPNLSHISIPFFILLHIAMHFAGLLNPFYNLSTMILVDL